MTEADAAEAVMAGLTEYHLDDIVKHRKLDMFFKVVASNKKTGKFKSVSGRSLYLQGLVHNAYTPPNSSNGWGPKRWFRINSVVLWS